MEAIGHWNEVAETAYAGSAVGVGTVSKGTSQFVVGSYNLGIADWERTWNLDPTSSTDVSARISGMGPTALQMFEAGAQGPVTGAVPAAAT
jgi:hypothetical protein